MTASAHDRAGVRRAMIRIALARCKPGSGSSRAFLLTRTTSLCFPDLSHVLGDTPYAVVGAAAVRAYMPERMTSDLDVAISSSDSEEARTRLRAAGYVYGGELAIGGSTWTTPERFPVDVIELDTPYAREAIAAAQRNRDAFGQPVMPLAYLILLKLESGRTQDIADISRMLGQADEAALDAVRRAVMEFSPDAAEDIESLITLGRLEMEQPPGPPLSERE